MGLDITAYRQLKQATDAEARGEDGEIKYEEGYAWIFPNSDFPGRACEFKDGAYSFDEEYWFRAGSYSGYNAWRAALSDLAGYPSVDYVWNGATGPFSELIDFSDCEGALGTAASAKLAKDFADFQEKADAHPDEWFREKYAAWRTAFEMAADGGAVAFH